MATETYHTPIDPSDTASEIQVVASEQTNSNAGTKTRTKRRTLFRHPSDKRLAGVCGGIGDYFDIDPVLIRILWILAALATGGAAILAYGLLWLVLPVGTMKEGQQEPAAINIGSENMGWVAWVLIGLGALWLLSNTGILPSLWNGVWGVLSVLFWPAVLIGGGILILRNLKGDDTLSQDVRDRVPDSETVKQSIKDSRQRIPFKRTSDDRILLGVCGGLARTLNIDPAIVRILWALFSIGSMGTGVILYVLLAIILPEDQPTEIEAVEGEILDPVA